MFMGPATDDKNFKQSERRAGTYLGTITYKRLSPNVPIIKVGVGSSAMSPFTDPKETSWHLPPSGVLILFPEVEFKIRIRKGACKLVIVAVRAHAQIGLNWIEKKKCTATVYRFTLCATFHRLDGPVFSSGSNVPDPSLREFCASHSLRLSRHQYHCHGQLNESRGRRRRFRLIAPIAQQEMSH